MTCLLRAYSTLAVLGILSACGPSVDSDSAGTGASGTGTNSAETGSAETGSENSVGSSSADEGNSTIASTSEGSSGSETTGVPPTVCGGECFADAVAAAYNTCQSDLDDYPCEAPRPCPDASVECDVDGENCVFEDGDADTYVEAIACVFNALADGSPGRYSLGYGRESEDLKLGTEWRIVNADVQADGRAQTFFAGNAPFEGGMVVSLSDVEVSCVQDQLVVSGPPADFDQAVSAVASISDALNSCSELCLQVFEGAVEFPSDLPCE